MYTLLLPLFVTKSPCYINGLFSQSLNGTGTGTNWLAWYYVEVFKLQLQLDLYLYFGIRSVPVLVQFPVPLTATYTPPSHLARYCAGICAQVEGGNRSQVLSHEPHPEWCACCRSCVASGSADSSGFRLCSRAVACPQSDAHGPFQPTEKTRLTSSLFFSFNTTLTWSFLLDGHLPFMESSCHVSRIPIIFTIHFGGNFI